MKNQYYIEDYKFALVQRKHPDDDEFFPIMLFRDFEVAQSFMKKMPSILRNISENSKNSITIGNWFCSEMKYKLFEDNGIMDIKIFRRDYKYFEIVKLDIQEIDDLIDDDFPEETSTSEHLKQLREEFEKEFLIETYLQMVDKKVLN